MKIFGIGTDIVNIKRMEKSLKKKGDSFKKKIFSKNEIIYCEKKKNPSSFYAKRFAAKEALSKALGTGIRRGIKFKDIEIGKVLISNPYTFALIKVVGPDLKEFTNTELICGKSKVKILKPEWI